MNFTEIQTDLASRVIKIIGNTPTKESDIAPGIEQYTFECLYAEKPNVFRRTGFTVAVVDKGTENEVAGYYGKEPPALYSDLQIGMALAQAQYGDIAFIEEQDGKYVVRIKSTNEKKVIKLAPDKKSLIELEAE